MAFTIRAARVGDPKIAFAVDSRAVWEVEHAFAERLEELAARVEFEDRWLGAAGARIRKAAMNHVDAAVGGLFDGRDGGPLHAGRQLSPVARGAVELRQVVARGVIGLSEC
jgi:hypothetical protein